MRKIGPAMPIARSIVPQMPVMMLHFLQALSRLTNASLLMSINYFLTLFSFLSQRSFINYLRFRRDTPRGGASLIKEIDKDEVKKAETQLTSE